MKNGNKIWKKGNSNNEKIHMASAWCGSWLLGWPTSGSLQAGRSLSSQRAAHRAPREYRTTHAAAPRDDGCY